MQVKAVCQRISGFMWGYYSNTNLNQIKSDELRSILKQHLLPLCSLPSLFISAMRFTVDLPENARCHDSHDVER